MRLEDRKVKIKIRVVIRKYRKDSGAGLEGEILRNDVLEVDYGMDHADEYDEIYRDMEEDDEDDEEY